MKTKAPDWAVALALAAPVALCYCGLVWLVDPRLSETAAANVWFDSDIPYRLEVMQRPGGWENGGAHPLFPTLGHLLLRAAMAFSGKTDPLHAASLAGAALGGVLVALLYLVLRGAGLALIDAALFATIGATSAAALFWLPVPESYGLAGVGVAFALWVAGRARPSAQALAAACAASGASVLTNGVVGLLAVLAHHRRPRQWGRALAILLAALGAVSAVWAVQEWSFGTPYFLSHRLLEYRQHTFPVDLERAGIVARGLLVHPVVAPALHNERPSFRRSELASSGAAGAVATFAWVVLLATGVVATLRRAARGEQEPLAFTAVGSLLLMLALHLTLGREMFLYALDVLPLLVVLAAGAALVPRGRGLVRAFAVVLVLAGLFNNVRQLARAADAAGALAAERLRLPASVPAER